MGGPVKRASGGIEVRNFLNAAVRKFGAQRQPHEGGAGAGVLEAGVFNLRHAGDHPRAIARSGELGVGLGEQISKAFLGGKRI